MTLEPDNALSIADAAGQCLNRFQQCLQHSALISSQETALVEDQLARFSLWAAGIGVFVGGRASLDHRLREAQEVHDVITGLLEALEDQVEAWLDSLESITRTAAPETAPEPERKAIPRLRRAVADQIALLHRLSNTIRRASSETQNAKVSMASPIQDEEGNDVEACLEVVFANYIRDKFCNMDTKLMGRMVTAMILRRKRISYKASRFNHGALKITPATTLPKAITPPTAPMNPAQQTEKSQTEKPQTEKSDTRKLQTERSQTGFSATTLAVEKFRRASASSAVSAAKTIALSSHEELPFPAAPLGRVRQRYKKMRKAREEEYRIHLQYLSDKFDVQQSPTAIDDLKNKAKADLKQDLHKYWDSCVEATGEITCPFCFYAIPAREMQNEAKWKAHVRNDLDAYVCLFDECDTPNQLYSHNEQWLKHMEVHALRWRCNSKSHGLLIFHTRDLYIEHMQQAHRGTFSEVQLRVLADRNARAVDPLLESCPFCGSTDTPQGGTIMEHIVGHLRFLALKSLPPYQDEGSEESDGGSATSQASKPRNRSTIDNDPDRFTLLKFEDRGSDTVNEGRGVEQDNTSSDGYSSLASERPVGLANMASLPNLASSSPIEEWDNFILGPPTGSNNSQESARQFEWGFVTTSMEKYAAVDDPVLEEFSSKRPHPHPLSMDRSQEESNTNDTAKGHMHSIHDIQANKAVVPINETPQQPHPMPAPQPVDMPAPGYEALQPSETPPEKTPFDTTEQLFYPTLPVQKTPPSWPVQTAEETRRDSAKSETDRLSDANSALRAHQQSDGNLGDLESSSKKPLRSEKSEFTQGEDRPGSPSSLLSIPDVSESDSISQSPSPLHVPVADASEIDKISPPPSPLHGDSSKAGHKDITSMQLSGEVSGVSDAPATKPLPEATPGPAQELGSILADSTSVGQVHRSPSNVPKGNAIDDSVLDDMISRLLSLIDTSTKKGRKRLFSLASTTAKKSPCINSSEIEMICTASRELFLSQPTLLDLKAPVKVVGDIHGQFADLIRLFQLCGFPPATNYLFLGDYVDRGKNNLETILLLLCYKLRYPENFFLLRGNHECAGITRIYGFYDECKRRTNVKTWKKFVEVFNCMPIAALIASKIFCVHGGLSPDLVDMGQIRQITRPCDVPDSGLLTDLLWSDPEDTEEDWGENDRGVSYLFGKKVITNFLQRHDIDLICRAHQVVEDGYEFYQDRLLVTIFSAPNYCGEFDNWGGIMCVSDELLCSFELLKPLNSGDPPPPPPKSTTAVEEDLAINKLLQDSTIDDFLQSDG